MSATTPSPSKTTIPPQNKEAPPAYLEEEKYSKEDLYSLFSSSGIESSYLKEKSAQIKQSKPNWEIYVKSNLISQKEYEEILKNGNNLNLILNFLRKINKVDVLQYLLAEVMEILTFENFRENDLFWITNLFSKQDELISCQVLFISSEVFVKQNYQIPKENLSQILTFLTQQIQISLQQQSNVSLLDISLQSLACFLRDSKIRQEIYSVGFYDKNKENFKNLLSTSKVPQIRYNTLLILWLFSFISCEDYQPFVLPILECMKTAVKEKVIRMALLLIKNLLKFNTLKSEVVMTLVGNKCALLIGNLLSRKFSDEDLMADLKEINEKLHGIMLELSTWDEFVGEVLSGKLEWSPVHLSETFWKQNAKRLDEKDFELLKILCRIIVTSTDPIVLSVACYDIGMYVSHHPGGKMIIQELGAKQKVMELMTHENPEVRYNALVAVQQYMSII